MSKSTKIKRYGGSTKRNTPKKPLKSLKIIGFIVGVFVVIFIGYSIAKGIDNQLKDLRNNPKPATSGTSEVSGASGAGESETPIVVDTKRPLKTLTVSMNDIFVTVGGNVTAEGKEAVLQQIKDGDYDSVLIELKDREGRIHYASKNTEITKYRPEGESANSVTVEALSAFVKELKAQNISAVARIYAFEDQTSQPQPKKDSDTSQPVAPPTIPINFIMNGGRWWDNNRRFWLNPNKPETQKYIIDIAKEITSMGFERVIVQSAHYPNLSGMAANVLDLGEKTRPQVLTEFAETLKKEVPTAQLSFNAAALTVTAETAPYFANPVVLGYSAVIADRNLDVLLYKEKILTIISSDDTLLKTAAENGFSTIKQ